MNALQFYHVHSIQQTRSSTADEVGGRAAAANQRDHADGMKKVDEPQPGPVAC
jgi:hypothetical protein